MLDIAGRTFAMVEAGSYPVELSETLDTQRYNPFEGTLQGSFSAHPHRDPVTGEHHAICYEGQDPGTIRHVVIDAQGRVAREQPIAVKHGPMIHDCAITERYVVILDLPVTFSMRTLLAGHGFPYRWNERRPARIGLMPRDGTADDIVWCAMAPGFAFHVANAYDMPDGRVALDVCGYDTMFAGTPGGPDAPSRGLERWTVDPATRSVTIRTIDAAPQEFPRIDERHFGRAYRHVYTLALPTTPEARFVGNTMLYRHDLRDDTRQTHDFGAGRHPGEFVFVPRSADGAEGEGWLIGLVIDRRTDTTDLVILDAGHFEEAPVASVHIPHRISPGFHGNWFASEAAR